MKETIVQQCLNILKRDDIKSEFKLLSSSIIDFVLYDIKPYIYLAITFIITSMIMNLIIVIMLFFVLNKKTIVK
jgi:hypothetical protein